MIKQVIGEFFEENYMMFKNYLKGQFHTLNNYDVEDIIQHTIMKLLTKGDDVLNIYNLTSYMYSSLQNGARDYFRRNKRVTLPGNEPLEMEAADQTAEDKQWWSQAGEASFHQYLSKQKESEAKL